MGPRVDQTGVGAPPWARVDGRRSLGRPGADVDVEQGLILARPGDLPVTVL